MQGTITQPGHAGSWPQHGSEHAGIPLQQQTSKECKQDFIQPASGRQQLPTWDMIRLWLVCLGPCCVMRDPGPSNFRMLMGHVLSTCSTVVEAVQGILGQGVSCAFLLRDTQGRPELCLPAWVQVE